MYYAYVLQSLADGRYYYGSSEGVVGRLTNYHNKGYSKYTNKYRPWILVYKEEFTTRSEAMRVEKFWKTGRSREYIKNKLKKK